MIEKRKIPADIRRFVLTSIPLIPHVEALMLIDRLAECYATHLVEITLLIHSRLDRKALDFANAFSWRTPR